MGKETVVLDLGRCVCGCPQAACLPFDLAGRPSNSDSHTPTHTHAPHAHSAYVKCGFAGESAPRCILPSPLDGWLVQARASSGEGRSRSGGWGVAEWEEALGPYLVRLYLHHLKCRPKVKHNDDSVCSAPCQGFPRLIPAHVS